MDSICRVRFSSLAIALVLASMGFATSAPQSRSHVGQVVDGTTGSPVSVEVKAWPDSRQTKKQGDPCPLFGDAPLFSARSGADGRFELKVEASKPTYTITYCASNYYPRADRDIPNESTEVVPNPARVYPQSARATAVYRALVRAETASALNNLAYLRSIDPREFDNVVAQLGKEAGTGRFQSLPPLVGEWASFTYRPQ